MGQTAAARAVATGLIAAGIPLLVVSVVLMALLLNVDSGGGATSGAGAS